MPHSKNKRPKQSQYRQRGQVLLFICLGLVLLIGTGLYARYRPQSTTIRNAQITSQSLAQAKSALIGYALSPNFASNERLGDLPCPDLIDSGVTNTACGNADGSTGQSYRIGRLPWRTLGLPDLRDGDGERLWYAVSNTFKYKTRSNCTTINTTGCINSDTVGSISIRNSQGQLIFDGSNRDPTNSASVIAVIFAPGQVIRRQDGIVQDRSCNDGICLNTGVCSSGSPAKCNPTNYLDTIQMGSVVEDNANFIDNSTVNGFILGPIVDSSGNTILNDKLILITTQDLLPLLERRVAKDTLNCLQAYASAPENKSRYPWPSSLASSAMSASYPDTADNRFGRVPDSLSNTATRGTVPSGMASYWPNVCAHTQGSWWAHWKQQTFYAIASTHVPAYPANTLATCGNGNCLTVQSNSNMNTATVAVIVAGRQLSLNNLTQRRISFTDISNINNYLENTNAQMSGLLSRYPNNASFNDIVITP